MSEHSGAEKSVKSILFGNMHKLFGKNRQKYFNMHNKSTLTYFKTSLAAFGFLFHNSTGLATATCF